MLVNVVQSDILVGERRGCYSCPVAIALFRATGKVWNVGCNTATCEDGTALVLPPCARKFIGYYDGGFLVDPLCFELELGCA